jgi:hypothetical protein
MPSSRSRRNARSSESDRPPDNARLEVEAGVVGCRGVPSVGLKTSMLICSRSWGTGRHLAGDEQRLTEEDLNLRQDMSVALAVAGPGPQTFTGPYPDVRPG